MLALIFVDALYLDIEQRCGINQNAGSQLDDPGQAPFVVGFYLAPRLLEVGIIGVALTFPKSGKVSEPIATNPFVDKTREFGIAERHETPGRHSIGDIEEAGGIQLVKIAKQLRFNQLRVQLGHSVDGMHLVQKSAC